MGDSLLLYEVAKLHLRDVDREIALTQVAKQAKATKPGLIKRFEIVSVSFLKKLEAWQKRETPSPDEHLFSKTNA